LHARERKVVVGWHGSGTDCSEAEEEESIYWVSEEESGSEGGGGFLIIFSN
jgi:hypothetical protein